MKLWNSDNKLLFGSVLKEEKRKGSKKNPEKLVNGERGKGEESYYGSERHWMVGADANNVNVKSRIKSDLIPSPVLEESQNEIPFDENGLKDILKQPLIPNQSDLRVPLKDYSFPKLPSVGKILQATMPEAARNALNKWKLAKIEELTLDGFKELQRQNLAKGSAFHSLLQRYFRDKEMPSASDPNLDIWQSVSTVLPAIDQNAMFLEQPVVHNTLKYHGIVDCVSTMGDHVYAIEWKKSDKAKSTITATYDAPLQLCAYLGALNASPSYNVQIRHGVVVVAYPNGRPAEAFKLDEAELHRYWYAWLLRVQEYWIRYRDGTLPPAESI